MDDLSDAIDHFATGTYTVKRPAATTYTGGRRNAPSTTTFTVIAAVVPATGRQLERLPEGLRTNETKAMYAKGVLRAAVEGAQEPDVVEIDGADWQVANVKDWQPNGGFTEALVQRVKTL